MNPIKHYKNDSKEDFMERYLEETAEPTNNIETITQEEYEELGDYQLEKYNEEE